MKRLAVALVLAVVGIISHASVINSYQNSASFPYALSTNNLLPNSFSTGGTSNGGNGSGVNFTYTFGANTEYVWFNLTPSQVDKLFVEVTSADHTVTDFSRAVSSGSIFWGFTAGNDDISSVRFFTTSANNNNVNNDKITVNSVSGYVQPPVPSAEAPEPGTVALLGLGLLGVAASRRKSAKSKNA
jgi:hypothetical protein